MAPFCFSIMKVLIPILIGLLVVGCGTTPDTLKRTDVVEIADSIVEKVTKLSLHENQLTEVPEGLEKLTQLKGLNLTLNQLTDVKELEKLTQLEKLYLSSNQLTDVKVLEKLKQLKILYLKDNPDLTKAQIAELQKALPNYKIDHNAK